MVTRALVLGGGGVTGIAWELGVLEALHAGGVPVGVADLLVGTSAGSVVAAQLSSGVGLDRLVAAQMRPPDVSRERAVDFDVDRWAGALAALAEGARDPRELRSRVGAMALSAPTVPEAERLEVIRARLPALDWPQRVLVTAVDTASGELVVWDRGSGVPLLLAVAASCAVPGVWPPVTIDGRRYMDGGVRSPTNADLAAGHDVVLVLAPVAGTALDAAVRGLDEELDALRSSSGVVVITPDEAAVRAIGPNLLDPARRAAAARAGQAQGRDTVDEVLALWALPAEDWPRFPGDGGEGR